MERVKYSDEEAKKFTAMVYMRLKGCTLQQIADEYGITREAVRQRFETLSGVRREKSESLVEQCIYPNLREWLQINEYTINKLKVEAQLKTNATALKKKLIGVSKLNITEIKKILKLTGKSFEFLFVEDIDSNE